MTSSARVDAGELASITGGSWERPPVDSNWEFRGICFNPLRFREGQTALLRSPMFRYGVEAHELTNLMRAAGVIVPVGVSAPRGTFPLLRVPDVRDAVVRLARALRSRCNARVIAVTGTVGKTSTCHLLEHLLASEGRVSTNGQKNYFDGIVAELTNLAATDHLVVETSLQALDDGVSAVLEPDVALLTHVSPVHITSPGFDLGSLVERKARVFEAMSGRGTAVINRDIPFFDHAAAIASRHCASIVTFGEDQHADYRLVDYRPEQRLVTARIRGRHVEYELGLLGRHMATNSLGVLAACEAAGVAWERMLAHCAGVLPVPGRGGVERLRIGGKHLVLIDDSYNANPASMAAALLILGSMPMIQARGRRIAILGDMLELGDEAPKYHREIVSPLVDAQVDKAYLVGSAMSHLWEVLPQQIRGVCSETPEPVLAGFAGDLRDGDVVLVKGSHGTDVHRLAANIRLMSLVPTLLSRNDAGYGAFVTFRDLMHRLGPHTPLPLRRWVSWQFRKLGKAE